MTARFRALLAALIVIVVGVAATLYVSYRGTIASAHDANASLVASSDDAALLDLALRKMDAVYYKPFDPQLPLNGETKALDTFLKGKHLVATLPHEHATGDPAQDSQALENVLSYAEKTYGARLGPNAKTDLTEAALRGVLASVDDPYTIYLSPKENEGLQESLDGGNFGGIGVYIYQLKDGTVVVQPIDGLPAARAGMKPGDVVDSVNNTTIRGMLLDRVEQMIRGEAGSTVQLSVHPYKGTGERHYTITREIIHVPTVHAKMEDGYDYIRLSDFGSTSASEIKKALLQGKAKNAKGYILDLRNNGGGFLDAAVNISSFFIPEGTIVSTIDRQGNKDVQEARGTAIGGLQPLVVLVNKYTASASEITAGALQDYHLAKIVGTKTFGKGVVQTIFNSPDGGAFKITTARYVTPLGRDIQHKGITPDVVVDQNVDPALIDTPADKQLAAAKAQLKDLLR
ncbi:MAG: S41 family peptidase [bacterium]|nr:S41 family peptidase [bacterium]